MPKFAIGQAVSRVEDATLLRGLGRYTDDIKLPNAAHAYVLRSPYAHARIASIDTNAAKTAAGVLAVLTHADVAADQLGDMPCLIDLTNVDGSPRAQVPRPILANGFVRHVGDPVALVVAETLNQAKDAAELVEIDYEELPSVVNAVTATQDGAPLVWEHMPRNLCFDWEKGDQAKVESVLKIAAHIARVELWNNRCVVNSLEPRSALADYDVATDRSTLYTSTQGPHGIRDQIAESVLKIGKKKLRCVTTNVGGSFGMKIFLYAEQCLMVWVSRKLKRAVRWAPDRSEAFVSDTQGRDNFSVAEMALDKDGHFLALKVTTHANLGAYLSNFGPFIPTYGTVMLAGVYKTPAIYVNVKGVMTNTVAVDAYRGAGRPEAIYLVERLVDVAARDLGLTPDEIRRRNFIGPKDIPYKTALGDVYDSGDFPELMQRAMAQADWNNFATRRAAAAKNGRLRGIGMAYYIETCGAGPSETAQVIVDPGGKVKLLLGMQDNGQGHITSHKQILSEKLGIDAETIEVIQGDTDITPAGMTGGSRFAATGGVAVTNAAQQVIEKGKEIAANAMEVARADVEYGDGRFVVAGTDKTMTLFAVAASAKDAVNLPANAAPGLYATVTETLTAPTYPNGCHVVEVEIDRDTGKVDVVRYSAVDDFGSIINPNLLAGQVHGGVAQGIGQALLERTVYDDESGQLLSGSFMDYAIARADDVPGFEISTHNIPCTTNSLGIKGAGEAGAIAAPPAVINAIVDALHEVTGLKHIDMPATQESVWRALHNAKPAKAA